MGWIDLYVSAKFEKGKKQPCSPKKTPMNLPSGGGSTSVNSACSWFGDKGRPWKNAGIGGTRPHIICTMKVRATWMCSVQCAVCDV